MNLKTILRRTVLAAAVTVCGPAFGATFLSFSASTYSVRENGSNAVISVLRAGNPHAKATVNYTTSNGTATAGSDYVATSGTLTFNSGQRLKTFSVPITDDLLTESNETINLALSNPSGGGQLRSPKTAVLTIIDNDGNVFPNVSIDNITANEGNSGTTPFVFHLDMSPASTSVVTVAYATADGSALGGTDYIANSGTLVFNPGETNKIITVLVNADTVNEPDKIFFVNITASTNATVAPAQGIGTIVNDDGPIVADDFYTTPENTALVVPAPGVMSNDVDVAGNAFTATLVTDVSHGTLSFNADGSFTYTPSANFIGADSFQYQTYDGVADSEIATVTITVPHVNRAPVANPDSFGTTPDTTVNVAAPGVLANDTDYENDALTTTLVAGPANGSVTLNADGSLRACFRSKC
jgi:VCBS repeat-containing protein